MEAMEMPTCYGVYWDVSAPECNQCYSSSKCEALTKQRKGGTPVEEEAEPVDEPATEAPEAGESVEPIEPPDPIEHLLMSLGGKFDRDDKDTENAVGHYFNKDGKTVVLVIVSKSSGRLKIQTAKGSETLDGIESIEKAEEILQEIMG